MKIKCNESNVPMYVKQYKTNKIKIQKPSKINKIYTSCIYEIINILSKPIIQESNITLQQNCHFSQTYDRII